MASILDEVTRDRHPAVRGVARRFATDHLSDPDARQIAMAAARYAYEMLASIRADDPELTQALKDLADARDGFIRAALYTR